MITSPKPNFFIVGAAKAGTTALWEYLNQHPEVFLSRVKEPHFFFKEKENANFRKDFKRKLSENQNSKHQQFISSKATYLELFKEAMGCKAIGEASASYLFSSTAAQGIYDFNPNSKVIIILRNPIERAFSHYLMNLRMGFSTKPFYEDFIHDFEKKDKGWGQSHLYQELGLYANQVERYLNLFSKENVRIVWHEDLKRNTLGELQNICTFLSIAHFPFDVAAKANRAKLPRSKNLLKIIQFLKPNHWLPKSVLRPFHQLVYQSKNLPKLSAKDRTTLIPFFKEDIKVLERVVDRDLKHWYNE